MATKGYFDTLYDNMIEILETYSADQPASEQFAVLKDWYRQMPNSSTNAAMVFTYYNGFNTGTKTSKTVYFEFQHEYMFDLVVVKGGTKGATYTSADKAAMARAKAAKGTPILDFLRSKDPTRMHRNAKNAAMM